MGAWKAAKAKQVLAALVRVGWKVTRQRGSHLRLEREGWRPCTFAFHEGKEIGPALLAVIAKQTGLRPEDL